MSDPRSQRWRWKLSFRRNSIYPVCCPGCQGEGSSPFHLDMVTWAGHPQCPLTQFTKSKYKCQSKKITSEAAIRHECPGDQRGGPRTAGVTALWQPQWMPREGRPRPSSCCGVSPCICRFSTSFLYTMWKGEINWPSRLEAKIRALLSLPLSGIRGSRHSASPLEKGRKRRLPGKAGSRWGKERRGQRSACTAEEDHSPWSAPCGKLSENHVQMGSSNKTQNLTVRQEGGDMAGPSPAAVSGFADPVHFSSP